MKRSAVLISFLLGLSLPLCHAQQASPNVPDAPTPASKSNTTYAPPTQSERLHAYVKRTFGIASVLEAGARGGIEQARDHPSQWPEGGQGYADRFGSAMGQIAIRGTTEYVVANIFKEDLRIRPCGSECSESTFKAALEDTFTARKGEDGHRAFSVARLVGPIAGSAVAVNTWYPAGDTRSNLVTSLSMTYGFVFVRNVVRELHAR